MSCPGVWSPCHAGTEWKPNIQATVCFPEPAHFPRNHILSLHFPVACEEGGVSGSFSSFVFAYCVVSILEKVYKTVTVFYSVNLSTDSVRLSILLLKPQRCCVNPPTQVFFINIHAVPYGKELLLEFRSPLSLPETELHVVTKTWQSTNGKFETHLKMFVARTGSCHICVPDKSVRLGKWLGG